MSEPEPFHDPESEQEHFAAVGKVASNWAYLEMVIDDWCFRIADLNPRCGSCFTSQVIGPGRKIDAFIALADLYGARRTIGKLHEFAKDRIAPTAERRNRAIHDPWIVVRKGLGHRWEITAKRKLRSLIIPVPTEELLKLAAEIEDVIVHFMDLSAQVYDEISSSPDKPQPRYGL